ncbi:MAG: 1,4-dihydroxy-2-naphthoate octaprenyltransferase [Prevotella sp.]|nr:1,4-dihydroxy-2-naphthoate octaprenyltransferase [Prevotellaceae bacterium]MDY5250296.1 1,4-dihydroxy-2-naphthoate octaprenyltransferase [Prevotella sp.]
MKEDIVKQNSLRAWILAARPKTLTGAAVPVMIGLALAYSDIRNDEDALLADFYTDPSFNWLSALLCLLFAFVMQIDANFINDFFDFAKGTDNIETRLGPKRACTQGWVSLKAMKHAIAATTVLAAIIGLPLIFYGGIEMILVGLVCMIFCFLYTTNLSYMGLGDVLVVVFFGIVPVCTTYYIQTGSVTWLTLLASLCCGTVVNSLLIVNNYRDRDTDREAGKMTLIVRIGDHASRMFYIACGTLPCVVGIVFCFVGKPLAFVLPLIFLIMHLTTYVKIRKIDKGRQLNECLGETARNIFVYGLLVTLGILL